MMRELKFRAWDKVDKKVKKVMSLDFYNTRQSEVTLASDGDVYLRFFEQVELMQSTGLKDKNGVEIFEGDIVREFANNYTPIYQNGIYMAYNVDKINEPYISTQFNIIWRNGCEVIGNIYENKDIKEVE